MQSTKQIKIPIAILEIIPRRLQRKIPDVRPLQGSAYIIRHGLRTPGEEIAFTAQWSSLELEGHF